MANVVGIDLETTFSAIAKLDDTGRPEIIDNSDLNVISAVLLKEAADEVSKVLA